MRTSDQERHGRHRERHVRGRRLGSRTARSSRSRPRVPDANRRQDDRRDGQVRHPRRHRLPHAPGHAVRRHDCVRRLRDRHARGGARRHDDDRRLRDPVEGRARCAPASTRGTPRPRARRAIDYGFHMIMTDANAADARGDGGDRSRGRDVVQDVHGLPGRVPRRRSADLPRDAARRRARRADHDARRDRPADRRARAARARRGPHARRSITRSRGPRSPRRPAPSARSRSPRWRRCRCTWCTCRRSARSSA